MPALLELEAIGRTYASGGEPLTVLTDVNLVIQSGEFVAIFDADFVPQRNFLMRTIGFFSEADIGIVQSSVKNVSER